MVTKEQYETLSRRVVETLQAAGIVLTPQERQTVEVADFGLSDIERTGLLLVTYVNTDRVCAKELVLLPGQTCPEHRHPTQNGVPGKEETFRCRSGLVYLYVDGEPTAAPACRPVPGDEAYYKAAHEVVLRPGEQYTLRPDTAHWFQAGPEGCIVSEFSTHSTDEADIFTDPRIKRAPEVADA